MLFPPRPMLSSLLAAGLSVVTLFAALASHAQPYHYPNLGQSDACAGISPRAGQINYSGRTCAQAWPAYKQRFNAGQMISGCPSGLPAIGITNVRCDEIVLPDGRPQANYQATGCCALPPGGVVSMPPDVVVASPPQMTYNPSVQFNPPTPSPLWQAGYTVNASCVGHVWQMTHHQQSPLFAPLGGYAFGPGTSNADLPVVLKNPLAIPATPNLVFAPHAIALHGSPTRCAALSFVAPATGHYHVQGNFAQTGHNPGVTAHPLRAGVFVGVGGSHLWSGFVSSTQGPHVAPFNLHTRLAAGQQLHFMSNIGGVLNSNTVILHVNVTGP